MISLKNYGSDASSSEDESDNEKEVGNKSELTMHLKLASTALMPVASAPFVLPNEGMDMRALVDPVLKEVDYNPKFEDMYAPVIGPHNPFKTQQEAAVKNTLSGFVEKAHLNDFQFEVERRTFHSYGYAHDPSAIDGASGSSSVVGDKTSAENSSFKTIFEGDGPKRPLDKRKREKNTDPSDIEGYLGPWAKFADEETSSKPTEEDTAYLEDYISKMKKRAKKNIEHKPVEETSTIHIKDPYDYQNRSFLHIPQDIGINLRSEVPPDKCFLPKKQIHEWKGHTKGISCIKWFPKSAHLILSGGMDTKVKLWEVYKGRRCIQTYSGHRQAIRGCDFNNLGDQFLTTSYDRFIKLWDTETGKCLNRFTSNKVGYCVKFNPDDDKQHLFVVGTADKKIVTWDIRSNEIVQEYERHLGAVNTITFVDENRRFVSTSDDKSLRVWEWDIPVDMKYIAEPSMHSMPAVTKSPNEKWLAAQSLDNKICIFTCGEKFRPYKKKEFKGHMVAGYACQVDFSPEMSYIISGDGDGKCCIWDWKTTRMVSKWKAHHGCCISALWHPHETSKVATAGWDGLIKFWD